MENSKNTGFGGVCGIYLTFCPVCNRYEMFVSLIPGGDSFLLCNNCQFHLLIHNSSEKSVISAIDNIKADRSKS